MGDLVVNVIGLAANQQRNQALAQYKRLELLLADELGVAPETDTIELYERIHGEHAAWSSSETVAHNLPAPLTPFIGRQAELLDLPLAVPRSGFIPFHSAICQ